MVTDSIGAIAFVGHVVSELSALRREYLKSSLRPEFHTIRPNNTTTTWNLLYGDDLAKQICDAKETNCLGIGLGSSAGDMLDFLKDYAEKREKVEEAKLKLAREMNEERKAFFNRFFEYMEKKT